MKMLLMGDNLRVIKVDDEAAAKAASERRRDNARRQRRDAIGRFSADGERRASIGRCGADGERRAARKAETPKRKRAFQRFFVLARPMD